MGPETIMIMGLIWSLFWKGIALWQAANRKHITWFVLILVVNSLGLLEIAYIVYLHRFDLFSAKIMKRAGKRLSVSAKLQHPDQE